MPADGLDRWIGDLRDRLERGDLASLEPIELARGVATDVERLGLRLHRTQSSSSHVSATRSAPKL